MVLDPSAYESSYATAKEPFALESQQYLDTWRTGLGATLETLVSGPGDLVLTPTRYLRCDAEGTRALQEAVRQVNTVDLSNVVFAVPVDAGWLTDRREHLVSCLRRVRRVPTALILGAEGNPVKSRCRAQALRGVIDACPGTALLRTDLAALDAMVHGAAFASIGDTASVRHTTPPGRRGGPPGSDPSPNLILPELMDYFRGSTLAEHLRDSRYCLCDPCAEWGETRGRGEEGRFPTHFQDSADTRDAHAHNMAIWSRWWRELRSEASSDRMKARWRGMCKRAYNEYEWHNRAISPRENVFKAPPSLRYWGDGVG
ncbi:hypothetical protein [Nocardiopsis sp. JB363]|uniref:hypothetical protein n=1 Tax=Nocardiopsis sp. JB363 TaxID=1434837 RepID=UPI00097A900D|nr:hypothetical protein [Nocardiopsis sp. JB363]SIO87086.1 hypothetical protein BQ8420_14965 [Nocardiopsis sp. JB363]